MSLRLRVALATIATTALVVIVSGGALIRLVDNDLSQRLDQTLSDQARVVAQEAFFEVVGNRVQTERGQPFRRPTPNLNLVGKAEFPGSPPIIYGDFPSVGQEIPIGISQMSIDDTTWRFYSTTASDLVEGSDLEARSPWERLGVGRDLVVTVALPTNELEATISDTRDQVMRVGLGALIAAGALGFALGTNAVRPLAKLRIGAEAVRDSGDLELRVDDQLGATEANELGSTLNAMLDRIQKATTEVEQALEASRAFAGNAAHELRTPLTSIQANLDVLEANPSLAESDRVEIIHDIQIQQARLGRLLSALRLLARGDLQTTSVSAPVDMTEIVDDAVHNARRHHSYVNFSLNVEGGPWTVFGWEEGLEVLVANLLENAAVHGATADPDNVKVKVSLTPDPSSPEVVTLCVDDSGLGVKPADRKRIFERFERANGASTGSGLGLALVAQQVELHAGSIEVDTSPLGGARFVVRIPINRPEG